MVRKLASQLVELTDAGLDEFIRERELVRRRTDAEIALAVAVADARALHEGRWPPLDEGLPESDLQLLQRRGCPCALGSAVGERARRGR